ncbi:MAG TPA: pantetheine-phosphate adenylyltransferase [Acidobacteriota bacterium]|nr:pantetheine-phosphate adenylyltransferase [Acidobacteriota bacterium]
MGEHVKAIYPGSFDPVTNGHLDIIKRGREIFGEVIVAILVNRGKKPLFSIAERSDMLGQVTAQWDNVHVDSFNGLLVDYVSRRQAKVILRGIRAVTDYEYEFQMALMNRRLRPQLETVFLVPSEEYSYLSSSLVREVATLGGSVQGLVPPLVEERLREKVDRRIKN